MTLLYRSILFVWVLIWVPTHLFSQSKTTSITVQGTVFDKQTKETLSGATIINLLTKKALSANNNGKFIFTSKQDSIRLQVSFIGYKTNVYYISKDTLLDVYLEPASILGSTVEVTATTLPIHESVQISSIRLTPTEIKSMPMQFGQSDVLKAFQFYPGVQMGIEGSSGIHVRGGSIDQTEILLDGIPVFNPYHSGGFVSTFHTSSIHDVELFSAGYPSSFGGRIGSYLDIRLKDGSKTKWMGEISLGLISAETHIEGPITSSLSLVASGRFNTLNNKISAFDRDEQKVIPENDFWDGLIKLNWHLNRTNQLNILYFQTSDFQSNGSTSADTDSLNGQLVSFYNQNDFGTDWTNTVFGVQHKSFPSAYISGTTTIYGTDYTFKTEQLLINQRKQGATFLLNDTFRSRIGSAIQEQGATTQWNFSIHDSFMLNLGGGLKQQHFEIDANQVRVSSANNPTITSPTKPLAKAVHTFINSEFEWSVGSLAIRSGVRWNMYNADNTSYQFLNPRLNARWLLFPSTALKASYAQTDQFMHLLTSSGFSVQSDLWIPSTRSIKPERGTTIAIGLAHTLNDWEFSIEAYQRDMQHVVEYKAGTNFFRPETPIDERVTQGFGKASGIETLIKKRFGALTGFVAYTLSKSDRTFSDLNQGNTFPYKYDRRHNVTTNWNYTFNKHFSSAFAWTYLSGHFLTLPDKIIWAEYNDPFTSNYVVVSTFSERNNYQMTDYHRLDLSFTYKRMFNKVESGFTLGAYNVYSRANHAFWSLDPNSGRAPENRPNTFRVNIFLLFPIQPFVSIYARF